jgi:hypothetical protein
LYGTPQWESTGKAFFSEQMEADERYQDDGGNYGNFRPVALNYFRYGVFLLIYPFSLHLWDVSALRGES